MHGLLILGHSEVDIEVEVYLYIYFLFSASNPTSVGGTCGGQEFILTLVAWKILFFLFLYALPIYVVSLSALRVFLVA